MVGEAQCVTVRDNDVVFFGFTLTKMSILQQIVFDFLSNGSVRQRWKTKSQQVHNFLDSDKVLIKI